MTGERTYNVLFLCTGNSARSILAESIVNHLGGGHFKGFSAGSQPKGQVHPYALDLLASLGFPAAHMHSKSWDAFAAAGAPHMDFVFTVCDNAAGEACPLWPGQPMTAHWGIADPAAVEGREIDKRAAFREAFAALENRIRIFMSLPFAALDRMALQQRLDAIGRRPPSSAAA
jgi:arsenate reductase